jgi:PAC2 family
VPLHRLADELPDLRDPVLVASFDGWVDAAEAASQAVAFLGAEAPVVASFDPDALFDYRSRRPILDVQDGRLDDLTWPALEIRHARIDGRDLLVFAGAEPDLRWQELAADAASLLGTLGVVEWISLGAVPAAVPHTMAVPVMATASQDDLLAPGERRGPAGLLRVPSAALSVIEMAVTAAGIPAAGFFAQVPPYASIGYAAASVALLERLAAHLGLTLDLEPLREEDRDQKERYDDAVASDARMRATVAQLEAAATSSAEEEEQPIPTGDELAREIEKFLRDQGDAGE